MEKVNLILHNKKFRKYIQKNMVLEKNRIFCRHDICHILDVARIAYIINLENSFHLQKELIYAVAMLHDIGRWKEYEKNIPHNIASAEISTDILNECGFSSQQINAAAEAIKNHRGKNVRRDILSEIIYLGDKISRNCFCCNAAKECNWPDEKKNHGITY